MSSEGARIWIKVLCICSVAFFQISKGCFSNDDCRFQSLVIRNTTIKIFKELCCFDGRYVPKCINVTDFEKECRINPRITERPWVWTLIPPWTQPQWTDPSWFRTDDWPTFKPVTYENNVNDGVFSEGALVAILVVPAIIVISVCICLRNLKSRQPTQQNRHACTSQHEIRRQNRSHTTNPFLVHNEMGGVRSLTSGGGMTTNQSHPHEEIYSGQLPAIAVQLQTTFNLNEFPPPPEYEDLYFLPPPKYEDVV